MHRLLRVTAATQQQTLAIISCYHAQNSPVQAKSKDARVRRRRVELGIMQGVWE